MKDAKKFAIMLGILLVIIILGKVLFESMNRSFIPEYNTNMEIKVPNFSFKTEETTTSVTYITLLSAETINNFFTEYFKTLTYKTNKADSSLPGIYYNEDNKIIIVGYSVIKEGLFLRTYQIIYSTDASLLENYQ